LGVAVEWGTMFQDPNAYGFLFLSAVAVLVVAVLLRTPARFFLQAIGFVFRVLTFPFRAIVRAMRVVGILPKASSGVRHTTGVLGASAWGVFALATRPRTETETALAQVNGEGSAPYDFAEEEKNLGRNGTIFTWVDVLPGYVPDASRFTDELAEIYEREAERFFSLQVSLRANIQSLYEDVDGAAIIEMFRSRDRRAFYLLNEMRKVINNNVMRLSILCSGILAAVFILDVFFAKELQGVVSDVQTGLDLPFGVSLTADQVNRAIFDMALCLGGAIVMLVLNYMEYVHSQRNNGREMTRFLTRYMARLSERYRQAEANARGVTVGEQADPAKLKREAQRWHKIVMWMAFRVFFVETYLRSVIFQIGRNSGYYLVFIPLAFFVALSVLAAFVGAYGKADALLTLIAETGPAFYVSFALLIWLYYIFLANSMKTVQELNQLDWLGYDNFHLAEAMDVIVGKYAEDVGYWKTRVRGGVG
jgi:hypothetical protein